MDNRSIQSDLSVQEISPLAYMASQPHPPSPPLDGVASVHETDPAVDANNYWSSGNEYEQHSYSPTDKEDSDENDESDPQPDEFEEEYDEFEDEWDVFDEEHEDEEIGEEPSSNSVHATGGDSTAYPQTHIRHSLEPMIFHPLNHPAYGNGYDMFPPANQHIVQVPSTLAPRKFQSLSRSFTINTSTDPFQQQQNAVYLVPPDVPFYQHSVAGQNNYAEAPRPQKIEIQSLISPQSSTVSNPRKRTFETFEVGDEEPTLHNPSHTGSKSLEPIKPPVRPDSPGPIVSPTFSSVIARQAKALEKEAESRNLDEPQPVDSQNTPVATKLVTQTTQTVEQQPKDEEQPQDAEMARKLEEPHPSKRRRFGDVALGMIIGGITTVATLASLPEGYFA
jgi:hypothetical protein